MSISQFGLEAISREWLRMASEAIQAYKERTRVMREKS